MENLTLHPQYLTDTAGKKLVVLPLDEYKALLEHLEDLEDTLAFDEAKREDDGERIDFEEYLNERRVSNEKV
jgi:hypothetical protein